MSKENIKATIDANIFENGLSLIRGDILNSVLKTMVDGLAEEGGGGGNVSGFVVIESVSDLPTNPTPAQQTLGYLLDRNLIVYVGEGGDVLDGKYKDCGEIKGIKGDKGDPGEPGEQGPVGPAGPRGFQGNTGSSVDYPYELVNNLDTDDATKGLSAAMGAYLKSMFSPFFEERIADTDSVSSTTGYLAATTIGQKVTVTSGATLKISAAIPVTAGMVCKMKSQGTGIAAIAWGATENGDYYAKAISAVSSGEQNHQWVVDQDGYVKFSSRAAVYSGSVVNPSERDIEADAVNWDKIPGLAEKMAEIYPEVFQGGGMITELTDEVTWLGGQSYGDVGSAIQIDTAYANSWWHARFPLSLGATNARIWLAYNANPSSCIQFVDDDDIIISRIATRGSYTVNAYNDYTLEWPEGATAVYISGMKPATGEKPLVQKIVGIPPRSVIGDLNNLLTTAKTNLVEAINEVAEKGTPSPFRFRYLSWNIGHFAKGNATESAITSSTYEQAKKDFRTLLHNQAADFCGICEFSSIFYPTTQETAKDAIFSQYKYSEEGSRSGGYEGIAFFGGFPMTDKQEWAWGGLRNMSVRVKAGGKSIILCEVHIPWSDRTAHANAIAYVLDKFKDEPYVVIAGDFNLYADEEMDDLQLFIDEGYQVANWGYMGKILTSYNNVVNSNYLDNIAVKGGSIVHTQVVQNTPEGADPDDPSSATEQAWDAVNLSDHFPIISDIIF